MFDPYIVKHHTIERRVLSQLSKYIFCQFKIYSARDLSLLVSDHHLFHVRKNSNFTLCFYIYNKLHGFTSAQIEKKTTVNLNKTLMPLHAAYIWAGGHLGHVTRMP